MNKRREPRKRGTEKKELIIVGKIRGFGAVTVVNTNKARPCIFTGKMTTSWLRIVSTGRQVICHPSSIGKGVAFLRACSA